MGILDAPVIPKDVTGKRLDTIAVAVKAEHGTLNPNTTALKLTSNSTVAGVDASRVWAYSSTIFVQRDTIGQSGSNFVKALPTNIVTTSGVKVISWPALGKIFLIAKNSSNGLFEVYSSPYVSGATAMTWTGPLLQLSAQAALIQTAVRLTSVGLLIGEYTVGANNQGLTPPYSGANDISGGPNLWKIALDGTTVTKILNLPSISSTVATRHIHGVYEDPYNLGHIWVTVGDQKSPHYVYKSTDGGATFAGVTELDGPSGTNPWQAVSMGFDAERIWFASDQVLGYGPLILDRATNKLRWASLSAHFSLTPVPGGVGGRKITDLVLTASSTGVASVQAAFTSADIGRFVTGATSALPDGNWITAVPTTTVAAGSNGATLPQATISVASTTGLQSTGSVAIATGSGTQIVNYTGLSGGNTLTGCSGGTGTLATGGSVVQATLSVAALSASTGASVTVNGDRFYPTAYAGALDPATGYFYFCANDTTAGGNTAGLFCIPGPDQPAVLVKNLGDTAVNNTELFIQSGLIWIGGYGSIPAYTLPT
jgi:hypothetical protein